MSNDMSRRSFLKKGTAMAAGLAVAPGIMMAGEAPKADKKKKKVTPPEKLKILGVGIGGRGAADLREMETEDIIGLCDVDWKYADHIFKRYPNAKKYNDYRVMFDEMLDQAEPLEELVIIGGGVIGMEFASFFNSIGTKVTVVEMLPKILGPLDDEISAMLQAQYAKKGVEFHLNCKVVGVEGNEVVYEDPDGNTCRAQGDKILVSVGRRANFQGIGLENLGVELALNPAGRPYGIRVDEKMRTNVPGVYAAGDVTGFSMLAHTASREGEVAVNDILGKDDRMHYDAIPGVVYTNPEVAGVGLTEAEAANKGLDYVALKLPMAYAGRFVAENERGEGLCKVIVDGTDHRVLGVHMLGNPCSEMIHSACIAIEQGMTVEQLKKVVFPHPTVSEILKETVFRL